MHTSVFIYEKNPKLDTSKQNIQNIQFKGILHPKINSFIIYSPSSCCKP